MRKNMRKELENSNGITLIALVITIIVLLILAGVSLSMVLNQNGIFSRAEQATDKYGQAKAREILEIAFSDLQMEKYERGLTIEALGARITEEINKMGGEETGTNKTEVIVDGYRFEIDRSVPKIIGDCLGKANGVIISAAVTQTGDWKTPKATVTGIIKTYSGGTITSSTAEVTKGSADITRFPTKGGEFTIENISEDTDIKIKAEDSNGENNSRTVEVKLKKDTTPPTISEEKAVGNGLDIKISAKVTDNESGVASFKYSITPTTGLSTVEGNLPQDGTPVTVTSTSEETYTISIVAEDNAGNKSEAKSQTVENWGALKHIKLSDGTLKEVNTKDIYGATVNGYSCTRTGVKWQIFYIDEADDHRVYLIAKDYVVPPVNISTVTPKLLEGGASSFPKAFKYGKSTSDGILGSYTTAIPGKDTTTIQGKFMGKFLDYYAGKSAISTPNLQATSYMLDQNVWAEYNGAKADLAFGGPTLPLFQASYNDTCRTETKLGIQQSRTGYQVKIGTGNFTDGSGGFGDTSTQKGIYFMGNSSNSAYGMWLASPSSSNADIVMDAYCDGWVDRHYYYASDLGFRPIVSLQSNVQFTSNADGTAYTIVN